MELKRLSHNLTVCKVNSIKDICFDTEFFLLERLMKKSHLFAKQKIPYRYYRARGWMEWISDVWEHIQCWVFFLQIACDLRVQTAIGQAAMNP